MFSLLATIPAVSEPPESSAAKRAKEVDVYSLAIQIYWVARMKLTMTTEIVTSASNGIFSNSFLVLYPQ